MLSPFIDVFVNVTQPFERWDYVDFVFAQEKPCGRIRNVKQCRKGGHVCVLVMCACPLQVVRHMRGHLSRCKPVEFESMLMCRSGCYSIRYIVTESPQTYSFVFSLLCSSIVTSDVMLI